MEVDADTMNAAWEEACRRTDDKIERLKVYMELLEEHNARQTSA